MLGALDGIRVLDLTRLAPGPYATMLLADHGADVIAVEPISREPEDERAAAHFTLGRNKRSICIDLKHPDGLAVFRKLALGADVVIEGFRPGVAERLGVGYDALARDNPRLVYCSLSGYGQAGPYAKHAGHDLDYIAIGGALGMVGRPESRPAIPVNLVADYAAGGLMATFAIVSALFARERTGKGQAIDVAMSDGVLSLLAKLAGQYFERGTVPEPGAHRINGGAPYYDVYKCGDGKHLAVGALEPRFFENLCRALGVPELAPLHGDEARAGELREKLAAIFVERGRDEWFARLRDADACVAPVYSLDEALADPHHRAREMVVTREHPRLGPLTEVGIAPKLSATPGTLRRFAPVPGADAREVLSEAGYDAASIDALLRSGAVGK
jgi:alpha-methylacyl-CoA racemase